MDTRQLDKILRHTLEDFRLSRGERRMLSTTLAETGAGKPQLALLRSRAFDIAREQIDSGADNGGRIDHAQATAVIEWLEEVVKVMQPAGPRREVADEAYFSPGDDCSRKIADLIRRARHKLDICVFTITDDRISDAIVDAHAGGTTVRIISDNDKALDGGSDIESLRTAEHTRATGPHRTPHAPQVRRLRRFVRRHRQLQLDPQRGQVQHGKLYRYARRTINEKVRAAFRAALERIAVTTLGYR